MLTHSTAVLRRALPRGVLSFGAVAVAILAFTGAASANVITVNPDGNTGSDNLTPAITQANTNGQASNTIDLNPGRYTPAAPLPVITHNLTVSANHALQAATGAPSTFIDGSNQASKSPGNLFTIAAGVTVRFDGFQLINGGGAGFFAISDSGNVTTWGLTISGQPGGGVQVQSGGSATLNETTLDSVTQTGISNQGTLVLKNSEIVAGQSTGIVNTGGTITLTSSLLAFQVGVECVGGTAVNGATDASIDDDGSCGVQFGNNTHVDTYNYTPAANGGPTLSVLLPVGNPDTTGKGINCPTVDQRFFVNPSGTCDIGATTNGAPRETTGPTCSVTALIIGPPKQQQVTVTDTGSGMGPNPGPATDNPSNTPPSTQPNSAVPAFGYGWDNLYVNNGTVSFTAPSAPTTSGVVLTATKTNQSLLTHWNFTATNWAGISTFCN
jgi:hypothetical protein